MQHSLVGIGRYIATTHGWVLNMYVGYAPDRVAHAHNKKGGIYRLL